MKWSDFYFPSWIPNKVKEQIISFWAIDVGRGPSHWLKNAEFNKSPRLGDRVRIYSILPKKLVVGRFIFAWNNIGRVIDDEGGVHVVVINSFKVFRNGVFRKPNNSDYFKLPKNGAIDEIWG